jgi:hypothetical protein
MDFLASLGDLSTVSKALLCVLAGVVVTGLFVLTFVGVSHEQSEYNGPDEEDSL